MLSAPADGQTILSVSPAHATAPAIFRRLSYDTLRDFAPVTLIGDGPALLVVPNDLKARTVADLVAMARATPGQMSYSSAGIGSSSSSWPFTSATCAFPTTLPWWPLMKWSGCLWSTRR